MNVLDWAANARYGERITYHRGTESPSPDVRNAALRAHYQGLVFLAQRRVRGGFAYEATRIGRETAWRLGLVPSQGAVARQREAAAA